jgi:hypothetical protein
VGGQIEHATRPRRDVAIRLRDLKDHAVVPTGSTVAWA